MTLKPVSMKMSKKDRDALMPRAMKASEGPKYPWGLTLRLDDTALDKLGMKDLPAIGKECQLVGVGRVVSVSQRETAGGKHRDVEIQVEKLALEHDDNEKAFLRGYAKGPKRKPY